MIEVVFCTGKCYPCVFEKLRFVLVLGRALKARHVPISSLWSPCRSLWILLAVACCLPSCWPSLIYKIDRFENAQNVMWWHFQLVCVLIFLLSLWCAIVEELVHSWWGAIGRRQFPPKSIVPTWISFGCVPLLFFFFFFLVLFLLL